MPEAVDGMAGGRKRKTRELTPLQRALALLVRREHSRKELARKLGERGIDTEAALAAVDKLADDGWQSDGRFAEMLVRTRVAHGQGPVRIRAELGTHGLDQESIEAALGGFEGSWTEAALEVARRRFDLDLMSTDVALRRKVADFLYRRGFDGVAVRAVLSSNLQD